MTEVCLKFSITDVQNLEFSVILHKFVHAVVNYFCKKLCVRYLAES